MTPTQPSASGCSTGLEKHPHKDDESLASRKEPLTCMHGLRRYHGLAHAVTFSHGHNPILGRGRLPHRTVQKKSGAPHCRIFRPPSEVSGAGRQINRATQPRQHLNTFTTQPHRPRCRHKLKRHRCLWEPAFPRRSLVLESVTRSHPRGQYFTSVPLHRGLGPRQREPETPFISELVEREGGVQKGGRHPLRFSINDLPKACPVGSRVRLVCWFRSACLLPTIRPVLKAG